MFTGTTPTCQHCGRPIVSGAITVYGYDGEPYHWECAQSPYAKPVELGEKPEVTGTVTIGPPASGTDLDPQKQTTWGTVIQPIEYVVENRDFFEPLPKPHITFTL